MEYIEAKHILGKSGSNSWFAMDYNMNIYRGCPHGCIYCDSRSDCYNNKDFDIVRPKKDALAILKGDLIGKKKRGVVATGAMSDPYNPLERQLELTRGSLTLLDDFGFGVGIATKSPLITRDIDILADIKYHSPVLVKITVTAAEDSMAKIIEPKAPPSSERLEAVSILRDRGIIAGILLMPVLPFILDNEENIKNIVSLAAKSNAAFIYAAFGVTQRDSQRRYFHDKLDAYFPGIKEKYINEYKNEYNCVSPNAKELWKLFARECEEKGIVYKMKDIIELYKNSHKGSQISLFD